MSNYLKLEQIEKIVAESAVEVQTMGDKTTVVKLTTPEGFVLIESSSCIDPENYDEKLGAELCLKKIQDRLWELEGYYLQKNLAKRKGNN